MYRIVGKDGQQYGPVSAEQLRNWIAENRANAQTLVQAEGTQEWKALSAFPEFAADLKPPLDVGHCSDDLVAAPCPSAGCVEQDPCRHLRHPARRVGHS